jgi:Zn-dependent M28 family amino/carboxypeptidase
VRCWIRPLMRRSSMAVSNVSFQPDAVMSSVVAFDLLRWYDPIETFATRSEILRKNSRH